MRRLVRSSLLTAALVVAGVPAAGNPLHLFILSGQSNMQGLKPENGFLPEAKRLLPDGEVVHLKVAKGGQPIRYWVAEWDAIAKGAGLKQANPKGPIFYDAILKGMRPILAKHPEPASLSFCWMQGERDAKSGMEAAYEAALKQLVANLRRDLSRPDLNVVIGRISDHDPGAKWRAGWEAVRQIHVKVAREDPHGAWVDTDDTNNKIKNGKPNNDLHYTREGYELFGQRLARQAVRLIRGRKPAPDGRPEWRRESGCGPGDSRSQLMILATIHPASAASWQPFTSGRFKQAIPVFARKVCLRGGD